MLGFPDITINIFLKTSARSSLIKFLFSKDHLGRYGDPSGRIATFRPAAI